jgi:ribosomal protein S18 acetylase RimI-like enzyme
MEIANQWISNGAEVEGIRTGFQSDAQGITRLLERAPYAHLHADWHYPADWLGSRGFVVHDEAKRIGVADSLTGRLFGSQPNVSACLAVAADPPPAAWVRVAAINEEASAQGVLAALFAGVVEYLQVTAVSRMGWLLVEYWPETWIQGLGFERHNDVDTFVKNGLDIPAVQTNPGLTVRPVGAADLEDLAKIEAEAFDPLWRHSAISLALARRHAFCFDVAEVDGRVIGFQFSTLVRTGAHLSRMTVDPEFQGGGVGSTLLVHAFEQYRRRRINTITLNTQADNQISRRLYQRFGFRPNGQRFPVWALDL